MRTLSLVLAAILVTLIATEATAAPERVPSSAYTCKIVTGYGTAIGKGSSKIAAKEAARELCGSKMIDDYIARRGNIGSEAIDDLALACVNLECE